MELEIWKDILDFEGMYQVSSFGRIRSLDRKVFNKANGTFSFIKGCIKKLDGFDKLYLQINLAKDSKYKKCLVHRLVAIYFVDNPENKPEVNHKDCDKRNNHYSNLEWTTRLENARHAKKSGKYEFNNGMEKPNRILDENSVAHIRRKELRNIDYCRLYNVKPSTVSCLQNPDKYKGRWKQISVEPVSNSYVRKKRIDQLDVNGNFIKAWESIFNASKTLKVPSSNIHRSIKNKHKMAGGYKWRYSEQEPIQD